MLNSILVCTLAIISQSQSNKTIASFRLCEYLRTLNGQKQQNSWKYHCRILRQQLRLNLLCFSEEHHYWDPIK